MFLQGRAAWGRSTNEISPYLTYTDRFDTERWLVSATLTGRWNFAAWTFRPSASVSYMEDTALSYHDTHGAQIPEVTSSLGQAKAGPVVGYKFVYADGTVIEPMAGLQIIWNFAEDTTAAGIGSLNGEDAGPAGVRGRIELGVTATMPSGLSLDLSSSYDGIGASDFNSYSGRIILRAPLN